MAGGEILQIYDGLDVFLHIADELKLHISAKEGASDLIEALIKDLLVNDCGIAHVLYRTGDSPS